MFDDVQLRQALAGRTPYQRGVVATLAAWRTAVVAASPGADDHFPYAPGFSFMVEDAADLLAAHATGEVAPGAPDASMVERFEELLGTEDEPEEEPDAIVPSRLFNAALNTDTAVRVWLEPGDGGQMAFTLLSDTYAFVARFDGEPMADGRSLVEAECARQLADLAAVEGVEGPMSADAFGALRAASAPIRDLIGARFQDLVDSKKG
jgi:hypothetical protein